MTTTAPILTKTEAETEIRRLVRENTRLMRDQGASSHMLAMYRNGVFHAIDTAPHYTALSALVAAMQSERSCLIDAAGAVSIASRITADAAEKYATEPINQHPGVTV